MCRAVEYEALITKIWEEFTCAKTILEVKGNSRRTAWKRQRWRMIRIDGGWYCDYWLNSNSIEGLVQGLPKATRGLRSARFPPGRRVLKKHSLEWTSDSTQDARTREVASFILIAPSHNQI